MKTTLTLNLLSTLLVLILFPALTIGSADEDALEAQAAFEKADKELNLVYQQLISLIREVSENEPQVAKWEAKLREAQRFWLQYRDIDCELKNYEWRGGSGRPAAYVACLERKTVDRIKDLKEHFP